jgi:hemoglobin/transferrin/lactoferrin receptor protein
MVTGARLLVVCLVTVLTPSAAEASTVSGSVSDVFGGVLPGASVVVRGVATGQEYSTETDATGRFMLDIPMAGTYLVVVTRPGFSEAARTVVISTERETLDVPIQLEVGVLSAEVIVTAARAQRESRQTPLHVDTVTKDAVEQANSLSTGDALTMLANITPVGNGPFGVRPRLRGLDSTRLLVLVDGERLNTARQATDRQGAEVGLIAPDAVSRMEVVNGAGTLLYGSDALAGTINIITNESSFSPDARWVYGFNGFYSSNENGRRGTATIGRTTPQYAVRLQAGMEAFDDYEAGRFDVEDTRPLFASGALNQADTIDDAFGFAFNAFPDPFNAPFVRTSPEIPNSSASGHFINASGITKLGGTRSLRIRYQQRRMDDIGFPDFATPYFFNATSLPYSNLDRVSARYEAQAITGWLANLSLTAHYQKTERLLRNLLPVQFPVPTPLTFFPINVMRLNVRSDTTQRVDTPGVDLQAVFVPLSNHVLTTGLTFYRDHSSDERTTLTTTAPVGQVVLGPRGPAPVVFQRAGTEIVQPAVAHPVRVPDASLRDIAVFAQDEWRIRPSLSLVAGLRGDFYRVTTEATPGYDVASVVAGAVPAIDPSTLPDPNGATYARQALTGDIGLVANTGGRVNPFVRFGRSYRHPNLEEMLFAGPATTGSIAPNVRVKPERGNNFDAGAKFNVARISGGAYVFVNQYHDFVVQDLTTAITPAGPLVQATNYADVRIHGLELSADTPLTFAMGVLTLSASSAFTRGTITQGINPLDGSTLDEAPADNITPVKVLAAARFTEPRGRWWVEYAVRTQTDVTRITPTLLTSPFRIAQDLLSLDGFTVQRLGWGMNVTRGRERLGVVFAIENLADTYYREHFQFAPSRGRSFTIGLSAGAF